MGDLTKLLNEASQQLIPVLYAIILIVLIIFIFKLISLIKELTKRVQQLEPTLRNVDISLEKVQSPLDTCVNLSHSVDKIHATGEKAVKAAVDYTVNQYTTVKKSYDDKKESKKQNQSVEIVDDQLNDQGSV